MGARQTYALACDGDGCEATFFPAPRVERYSSSLNEGTEEVVVVPRAATKVRAEAAAVGWSHVFHQGQGGQGKSIGWYEDHCPACTKELSRA
jgi:hypothetical protein